METRKTTPHSSSDLRRPDEINLTCPRSWDELTQKQLHYVLFLLGYSGMELTEEDIKVFCMIRFTGVKIDSACADGSYLCHIKGHTNHLKVRSKKYRKTRDKVFFTISAQEVASLLHQLDFIFQPTQYSCRLAECAGRKAVDEDLGTLPFRSYLTLENYYQAYLMEPSVTDTLAAMGDILYPPETAGDVPSKDLSHTELINVFMWYTHAKHEFATQYGHLFAAAGGKDDSQPDMLALMNAQIRALTKGDVTKEEQIFGIETRRALTELDALARDAAEMKRRKKARSQ